MTVRSISESMSVRPAPASAIEDTSLMGLAVYSNPYDIGPLRRSIEKMDRREAITWLEDQIRGYAKKSNDSRVPVLLAVKIALQLNVSEDTAVDYCRQIERKGTFGFDRANFIVPAEGKK